MGNNLISPPKYPLANPVPSPTSSLSKKREDPRCKCTLMYSLLLFPLELFPSSAHLWILDFLPPSHSPGTLSPWSRCHPHLSSGVLGQVSSWGNVGCSPPIIPNLPKPCDITLVINSHHKFFNRTKIGYPSSQPGCGKVVNLEQEPLVWLENPKPRCLKDSFPPSPSVNHSPSPHKYPGQRKRTTYSCCAINGWCCAMSFYSSAHRWEIQQRTRGCSVEVSCWLCFLGQREVE